MLLLFSHQVVSDSLQLHGLQHTGFYCPSLSAGVCLNSCPLSWWCCPTISSSAALFFFCPWSFPTSVFPSESALRIRWPKYWSFSISPSNEDSALISFRIDWFGLLAVQGALKSFLEHHSLKASILCLAYFMVQISQPFMTTGKTIALTIRPFNNKETSLLFNMLPRLVIAFLQGASIF